VRASDYDPPMTVTTRLLRPASGDRPLACLDTHGHAAVVPRAAVVFVHAFPLGMGMWMPQLLAAPDGWRFVAPALRGFDATEEWFDDGRADIDQYADDVFDVMDGVGIERAVVVGLSMGGYVTFAMFRKAPERISGLLLADTRATADSPAACEARRQMLARVDREGPGRWLADEMLPKLLSEETRAKRAGVAANVREMIVAQPGAAVHGAIQRMLTRPDSTSDLARITVPTAVVVGEQDTLTPLAESQAIQAGIRGSVLEVIPAAGHLSNLDQPADFNFALARLLARISS